MKVTRTEIREVLLVEPDVFADDRGYLFEAYNAERYAKAGIATAFVQDNVSFSRRGVLRGLHFQHPYDQGKLVGVLDGEVFDVVVDVRRGSPTFKRSVGFSLSSENKHQVYVPPGFAHGYLVLSPTALFAYKCTAPYHPASERTIRWNDPALGIDWPLREVILHPRDGEAATLDMIPSTSLPEFGGV